jgi:hypothetical protein
MTAFWSLPRNAAEAARKRRRLICPAPSTATTAPQVGELAPAKTLSTTSQVSAISLSVRVG